MTTNDKQKERIISKMRAIIDENESDAEIIALLIYQEVVVPLQLYNENILERLKAFETPLSHGTQA